MKWLSQIHLFLSCANYDKFFKFNVGNKTLDTVLTWSRFLIKRSNGV